MKAPPAFAKLMRAADRRLRGIWIEDKKLRMETLNLLNQGRVVIIQRNLKSKIRRGFAYNPDQKWRKVLMRLGQRWE